MSGKKGRSGRRTTSVEEKCLAIRDKSRDILLQTYNDPTISLIDKAKLANPIVVKEMAQKIEQTGTPLTEIRITNVKTDTSEPIPHNRIDTIKKEE